MVIVPGVGTFSTNCQPQNWSNANSYCSGLDNSYRLPSGEELIALYNAYPDNQMSTVWEWPTDNPYWSFTSTSAGTHHGIGLHNGSLSHVSDNANIYVACVR